MYFTLFLCFLLLGWGCGTGECAVNKTKSVNVAAIGPWIVDTTANFNGQFNFLNFAASYLNNQTEILPDVAINIIKADTGTNPSLAISVSVDAVAKNIIAFIGGARTPQQQIVSYLANAWQIPHIGGIVTGAILSEKANYPYFMRTSLADQFVCEVIMKYILLMKWKNVVLISQTDDYGTGNRQHFLRLATLHNVTTWTTQVDTHQRDFSDQISQIEASGIKILVFLMQINEAHFMLKSIKEDGRLKTSDYVYLIGQVYLSGWYGTGTLNGTIFDGSICFSSIAETTPRSTDLWNAWLTSNTTLYPGSRVSVARNYWFLTEALYTLALGLQEYIDETGPETNLTAINGTRLYHTMRKLNYTGVSGQVQFNNNGDRLALCNIYNVRQADLEETSSFYADVIPAMQYNPFTDSFTTYTPITFYGGRTSTPRDTVCPCVHGTCDDAAGTCICYPSYEGALCEIYVKGGGDNTEQIVTIVVPIAGAAAIALIAGFLYYRRKQAQIVKEVTDKQRSDIPRSSIKLGTRIGRGASGEVYSAVFRGTEVAVKVLSAKNLSASALQQFQLETAIMTGLRHPNIILFMGSCYDKSKEEFLLVMELCARGSLYDVLYNKNISLSMELQLHLAYQIVQGINFLHQSSPPIIHCDIKSHNVLLDEKWNCRICDFGITIFSSVNKDKGGNNSEALGTVYWTAPEVLTGGRHTMQSDSYAVGILLWEIFHRQLPYAGKDPLQVAMEVCNLGTRPVMGSNVPPQIAQLITGCWSQDPAKRPSTQDIVYTLRDLAMDKPMSNYSQDDSVGAPTGSVVFVHTEVSDAYKMWDAAPKDMQLVMKQHNTIMRTLLESYKGYEAYFNDHSFFLAFARITDAMNWCLAVQSALVRTTWPASILALPSASRSDGSSGHMIWNGPRVKMVVHKGVPQCVQDKISQHMKYEGPVVKRVMQLRSQAVEGAILVSKNTFDDLQTNKLEQEIATNKHKNILAEEGDGTTFLVVPVSLQDRLQTAGDRPGSADSVNHPYTILDIDSDTAQNAVEFTSLKPKETWVVHYEDLTIENLLGMGSGAEVHSARYKGQEVAVKMLINQNFNEENSFTLKYLAATLSKVDHPNVLRHKGFVLDPPHICIVTEMMQNSLYKFYSSNTPFPHSERVRIAKGVAAGMLYLAGLEDSYLGMNQRLNSNNILLGRNGEVKISDFATNKLYDSNRTLTSVNAVAWTPPEMLGGDEHISAAVPIYAFGIVMWEMLTRKRPYTTIHPIRLLNMVAQGHRPDIPSDCPPAYASLMQDCWEGSPSARPSWDAILRRLNAM